MPPRLQPPSKVVRSILRTKRITTSLLPRQYATAAASIASTSFIPPPPISQLKSRHPTTQPASLKPAEFRKTQLLRQYASLLHSTPLLLLFQHNNLKSSEWVAIRRELALALAKVDAERLAQGLPAHNEASAVKLQIVQTGILAAALRIVEYFNPASVEGPKHALSKAAHDAAVDKKTSHAFAPLLAGPVVLLTFPTVSPQHLKAALTVLSPSAPNFPAPTRRANPGWHDNAVQTGLQKLMLLGARVEGKVFDVEGARWVGSIGGGLDGLRAQLVQMLQSVGGGVTNTLESAGKSLFFTVEGRRMMLEEEEKGPEATETEAKEEVKTE